MSSERGYNMPSHLSDNAGSLEEDAAKIWSKTAQKLPRDLLKFSPNAVEDILPNNTNLIDRKNENLSSACQLCGEKQTCS